MNPRKGNRLGFESLEQRCVLSATVFEHDGIGYFLNQYDPGVARYDIDNEQWLTPIDFVGAVGAATYVHGDDDGFYVAYGKAVYRYNLDGTGQTHVISAQNDVQAIHTDGNLLFVNHSVSLYAKVISIDKNAFSVIDTIDSYVFSIHGSSISTVDNRIFGRSAGVSPADISYVSYDDSGNLLTSSDSPYHGDYPGGGQTWVFADGLKVVDSSGTIYSTALTYLNSFQSPVDDIAFVGGQVPIVLNDNTVTAYTPSMLPTGEKALSISASNIFVNDRSVIAFNGTQVEIVPLTALAAPTPGEAIDPRGLPYVPDKVDVAVDGAVLLYSEAHQSIFRWDPVRQEYGETIPLIGSPMHVDYSPANNTIYLAYQSGLIRKIDLDDDDLAEVPFVTLPSTPYGVTAAGEFVFTADSSGAWESHYTYNFAGELVASRDWTHSSQEYIWNEATRRMYYFTQWSPRDMEYVEIGVDGSFGAGREAPQHDSAGFSHPIRVAPNGSLVVLGSGVIHDGTTLARLPATLGMTVNDIAWLTGSNFYTISGISSASVRAWGGTNWGQLDAASLPGTAISLVTLNGSSQLLAITSGDDGPVFTILDEKLDTVPRPVPVAIAGADRRVDLGSSTSLDASASYDPDNQPGPLTYSWSVSSGPDGGQFASPDQPLTAFTATAAGIYEVQLTVSDGSYSASDTVVITYRLNEAPVADATLVGPSGIAGRGPVSLSAAASTDANGDPLSFQWEVIVSPAGSQFTLNSPDSATPSLSASQPGQYTIKLTANDGVLTGTDTLVVTFAENQAPMADPSRSDATGVAGRHAAILDASASSDIEGDALTYAWEIVAAPAGSAAQLPNASAKVTQLYSTTAGNYLVKLTVSDGLKTDSETLLVTIGVNQSPVADASASQTVIVAGAGSARLDGTRSHDLDDIQLAYSWQVVASSNGKVPNISQRTAAVAFLNASQPGIYAIELTVSDGLSSATDYVIVEVTGNQLPLVDVSRSDRVVLAGVSPQLNASGTFDPDGDPMTFSWTLVAASNQTSPTILEPNQPITRIESPLPGSYTVKLTVNDGSAIATAFVLVTVREVPTMPGDFDGNGQVNGRDFLVWQRNHGATNGPPSDGNLDGVVDHADMTIWSDSYRSETATAVTGPDFDKDGDVDGRDFLAWQRNPSASALNDWQANYSTPASLAASPGLSASTDSELSQAQQALNAALADAGLVLALSSQPSALVEFEELPLEPQSFDQAFSGVTFEAFEGSPSGVTIGSPSYISDNLDSSEPQVRELEPLAELITALVD